ncbi:MAG TPA: cobyrinic acid a,c-diamide synthase [Leptolyngbyaceae cyanobacterium]|jgi:hypothetical protein
MTEQKYRREVIFEQPKAETIFEELPLEAREWAESLPWNQRRYILLLCHLLCVASPEKQAEFLDSYTADGLVSRKLQDRDTQHQVKEYLKDFYIEKELDEPVLRGYIRQFYIHSSQQVNRKPEIYFQSVFQLILNTEKQNNIFSYILGFEILKLMFKMSWLQHERLYQLQKNQEDFIRLYIKPIQTAHKINGIVVPDYRKIFFDKREFFVKKPHIKPKKLIELVMATFTTDVVSNLGFLIMRDPKFLAFDYEYIFQPEPEGMFPE